MKTLVIRLKLFALIVLFFASAAFAQPKMGAIGDSLLDEHFDQSGFGMSLDYSRNGLELMVINGKINAGPLGAWGGTRNNGYEYNWALAGETTGSLIANAQHTNLAAQVGVENIPYAVMIIGANDLFPVPPTGTFSSSYEAIYEGVATAQQINAVATQAIADVVLAAQTLKNSGVKLVVATPPDYGISPFAKYYYPDPVKRDRVDDVVEFWTTEAAVQLTRDVGVPVVEIYRLTKDMWGDHGSENPTFELGGVLLDLNGTGGVDFVDVIIGNPVTPTADTNDAFVHDGIHPNNTIGGIFANLVMTAFNEEYGTAFELFTEQQILSNAGPSLGGLYTADTFSSSLGGKTYSDYVISAISPTVTPDAYLVTRGVHISGDETSLSESDNIDLSLQRLVTDIQSRTEFEVVGTSPTASPSSLTVTLEGAVFARSTVVQTIELWDYVTGAWELVDTRNATNIFDSIASVVPTGDLSRFVDPTTLSVEARVHFQSLSPRQRFASNTDQFIWTIE